MGAPNLNPHLAPNAGIIYGPIEGSRFGRSIGLNLLGNKAKLCSFDCVYCDLGATETRLNKLKESGLLPDGPEILAAIETAFRDIHDHGPMIHSIAISGNGEPTLHPDFADIISGLVKLRDRWLTGKPIHLLTNGGVLDNRRIAEAANRLDERIVKIDAGNEKMFKLMNTPLSRVTLQKVINGVRGLKDVTIQAMFTQGTVDNTLSADIDDWLEVMALLKPKAVHIQGISRKPQTTGLIRCDEDTLHTIASKLERRTGLKALILP